MNETRLTCMSVRFPARNCLLTICLQPYYLANQMKTCPMDSLSAPPSSSWLYLLERFDVGVVNLDLELRVMGMNDYARRCLPVQDKMPFGKIVTSFHPESAQHKVRFLLGQAECPVNNAPPMAMMINIPDRMLLIKVSKIGDVQGATKGYTLVFYDITEVVSQEAKAGTAPGSPGTREGGDKRQLRKIPTIKQNRVLLVDVPSVSYIRSEGHYTWVHTAQGSQFCNLNIGDLESRLDPHLFMRVHRSYIVNLSHIDEIVRSDGRMTLHMIGSIPVEIPVSRASAPLLMEQLGLTDTASAYAKS